MDQLTTALSPQGSFGIWAAGVRTGIRTLPAEPLLGLKRLALPVSYWRTAEFAYVCRRIVSPGPMRVLDLGSPKDLATFLARDRGYEVVATDILPEAVALSRRYAAAQGLDGHGPGQVHAEVQDGRQLTYPDAAFDAAFSVSVLEHIPDAGDSKTIRELVRVIKPGGVVVITTPYDRQYRETFVEEEVYEREYAGKPVFFERHYDENSLKARLIGISGGTLDDLEIWGERSVRIERLLGRLGRGRDLLSPLEALLSGLFLRRIDRGAPGHPMAAFFTLRKP